MSDTESMIVSELRSLADRHGLLLSEQSLQVNELGLDYRVATGRDADGESWVLRVPRREDVVPKIEVEAAVLDLVASSVTAAVPDWRICSNELIAYPLLPGKPGVTFDGEAGVQWHLDTSSQRYAQDLGDLLAELHAIPSESVRATGADVLTPQDVRQRWRSDIATVVTAFDVAADLRDRWEAWLADDSYWPTWSAFCHGELYQGHTLVGGDNAITGVIDWTTASVGDPARDFMFQATMAPRQAFEATVERYVSRGGTVWPRLYDHCVELSAAGPVGYGLYAIVTGDAEHHAAAAAQLNPPS